MKKTIFVLCLTGCSFAGTGTGNPLHNSFASLPENSTRLMSLISKTCDKISSCHPSADKNDCWDFVSEMTEYSPKLGATETPASLLSELIWADYKGDRPADPDAVEACQTQVELLNCSDSSVQNAFDSNLANPFANSAEMLAPECTQVFDP